MSPKDNPKGINWRSVGIVSSIIIVLGGIVVACINNFFGLFAKPSGGVFQSKSPNASFLVQTGLSDVQAAATALSGKQEVQRGSNNSQDIKAENNSGNVINSPGASQTSIGTQNNVGTQMIIGTQNYIGTLINNFGSSTTEGQIIEYGSASVEIAIAANYRGTMVGGGEKSQVAIANSGEKEPIMLFSGLGVTVQTVGSNGSIVRCESKLDMNDKSIGQPLLSLTNADVVAMWNQFMPDSTVIRGSLDIQIDGGIQLHIPIPPQPIHKGIVFAHFPGMKFIPEKKTSPN